LAHESDKANAAHANTESRAGEVTTESLLSAALRAWQHGLFCRPIRALGAIRVCARLRSQFTLTERHLYLSWKALFLGEKNEQREAEEMSNTT
jgi:hypothetical protein